MGRRDVNEAAHHTIQSVIDRTEPQKPAKNLAAVALGKLGGLKGGPAGACCQAVTRAAPRHRQASCPRAVGES